MITVGIRELKAQASDLVRQVRESGSPVLITYHGKAAAMLVAVEAPANPLEEAHAWASLDELAAQIGQRWPEGLSAAQAVAQDRS
jgi:prevent-host-death family protein